MNLTKKYKLAKNITGILSFLLMFGPSAYYIMYALITTGVIEHKIALVSSVMVTLIFTLIALLRKFQFRSKIWIFLIAIYVALGSVLTPIIVIGSCQIIDELLVSPLHKHYRLRYKINKEIDARES